VKIRVYYKDTDCGGIVYHSNYLNFCEMARSELFFKNKKSPFNDGCHFAIKNLTANFVKPALLGDLIEVKTKLLKMKHTGFIIFHQIYKDKTLLFEMEVTLVNLCKDGRAHKIDNERKEFLLSLFQDI